MLLHKLQDSSRWPGWQLLQLLAEGRQVTCHGYSGHRSSLARCHSMLQCCPGFWLQQVVETAQRQLLSLPPPPAVVCWLLRRTCLLGADCY